jgi:hypothetical protein
LPEPPLPLPDFYLAVIIVVIVAAFLGIVIVITAFFGQLVFPEGQHVIVTLARAAFVLA